MKSKKNQKMTKLLSLKKLKFKYPLDKYGVYLDDENQPAVTEASVIDGEIYNLICDYEHGRNYIRIENGDVEIYHTS